MLVYAETMRAGINREVAGRLGMINRGAEKAVYAILAANAAVTALVPADRIYPGADFRSDRPSCDFIFSSRRSPCILDGGTKRLRDAQDSS